MLTGVKPNLFWQKSLRRGSSAVAGGEIHPERLQSLEGESLTPQPPLELQISYQGLSFDVSQSVPNVFFWPKWIVYAECGACIPIWSISTKNVSICHTMQHGKQFVSYTSYWEFHSCEETQCNSVFRVQQSIWLPATIQCFNFSGASRTLLSNSQRHHCWPKGPRPSTE